MNKLMSLAAILVLAFILQSCHKIKGEGPVITRSYSLSGFTAIDAGIDADVYVTQDNFYKVEIQAQENILSKIETPIVNGELKLQFEKYINLRRHDRIVVYITAPDIAGLGINGSGTLSALQPISSARLYLKVNGSGSVSVSSYIGETLSANISGSGDVNVNGGAVNSEALKISGSGTINLLNLSAKYVSAETSGSGKTTVRVSDNLDVSISGSGDVYYAGNPSVHTVISGSGRVSRL